MALRHFALGGPSLLRMVAGASPTKGDQNQEMAELVDDRRVVDVRQPTRYETRPRANRTTGCQDTSDRSYRVARRCHSPNMIVYLGHSTLSGRSATGTLRRRFFSSLSLPSSLTMFERHRDRPLACPQTRGHLLFLAFRWRFDVKLMTHAGVALHRGLLAVGRQSYLDGQSREAYPSNL